MYTKRKHSQFIYFKLQIFKYNYATLKSIFAKLILRETNF